MEKHRKELGKNLRLQIMRGFSFFYFTFFSSFSHTKLTIIHEVSNGNCPFTCMHIFTGLKNFK